MKQQFWPGFLNIAKNERLLDLVMTPKGCYNSPFFLATEAEFIRSRLVTIQNKVMSELYNISKLNQTNMQSHNTTGLNLK